MFRNYLVTIFRNLVRNKVNTFINVAGLAISIACCIVIYVFVKHENTFDNFHRKADRIYRVVADYRGTETGHAGYVNFALAKAMRNDFPHLETVTQVYVNNNAVIGVPTSSGARNVMTSGGSVRSARMRLAVPVAMSTSTPEGLP